MRNSAGSAATRSRWPLLSRNAAGKRAGPTEAVVAWAWTEELPKAPKAPAGPEGMAGGWDKAGRFGEYLSLVEMHGVNRYGVVPDFSADAMPHPDARMIADAVFALDAMTLEMPEDWRPAPELDRFGGMGAKAVADAWRRMTRTEDGRTVLRVTPSDLVIRRAVMGADLDGMGLDGVTLETERHPNGKPKLFLREVQHRLTGLVFPNGTEETVETTIEVSGVDRKGNRKPGAYEKQFLDPDPVAVIVDRAEHEIWCSCMALLANDLAGRLETVDVGAPSTPVAPWLGLARVARVLPDLASQARHEADDRERFDALARSRWPAWFRAFEKRRSKFSAEAVDGGQ